MKKRSVLLVVMLVFSLIVSAGCGGGAASGGNNAGAGQQSGAGNQAGGSTASQGGANAVEQNLTLTLTALPTIDPQKFNASVSYVAIKGFGEGLIRTFEGEVTPGVAESWEVAEDNLSMTFNLRKDACWSDGSPLNAHDFVYSFRRLADQGTGADYRWVLAEIVNGEDIAYGENPPPVETLGVEALDDYTFKINFHTPAPYYLSFLDMPVFYPTKQELVEQYGDQYAGTAETILGNGPFKVTEYLVDQSVTMVPNENYWNAGAIKLEKVNILIMEKEAAFALVETGAVDMILDMPVDIAPGYLADPSMLPEGVSVASYKSGAVDWFCINIASATNPILGNKDFRLALNYALDREEYVKVSSADLYTPATRFVLPTVSGLNGYYADEYPINVYKTTSEMDKAQEHLQLAMSAMGISDPSQIKFTLTVGDNTPKAIAENTQDQWQRKLGINVDIQTVTYKAMLSNRTSSDFDLIYAGWMPDFDDPYTYLGYFISSNSQNGGKYSNPRYDELVNTANNYPDAATRLSMYAEAETLLLEEAGLIPLQVREVPYAYNNRLKNVVRFYLGGEIDYTYAYFE